MSACNLCRAQPLEPLIEFGPHPIAHRFVSGPGEEEYTHPLTLGLCERCGLVQLIDPIPPQELYTNYHVLSSWKPTPHVPDLAAAIERLPGITTDSRVVEVGSNDGAFLAELRDRGFTNLIGLEPAADAVAAAEAIGVPTIRGYFTPEIARELGAADLFLTRHVLEHIGDLATFTESMRLVLAPGAHVLVEVPDFDFGLDSPDYSAVWEEHVNHFTRGTMAELLARAGVQVDRFESYPFSGQALVAWGRQSDAPAAAATDVAGLRDRALNYRDRWPAFATRLREYLSEQRAAGRRVGVYGAGCRAATLINIAGVAPLIDVVVDDQPEKQGKLMPGSHLPIVPGDTLEESGLDLCLLAVNAENEERVIERHSSFVERGGTFASLHPPSPRLPNFWQTV